MMTMNLSKIIPVVIAAAMAAGLIVTPTIDDVQLPPQDYVEQAFYDEFETRFGDGAWAVRMVRGEGWNSTSGWDLTFIRGGVDAGAAQINQIHADPGEVMDLLGLPWPSYVQTLEGNLHVAVLLYERDRAAGRSGRTPWDASLSNQTIARSNAKARERPDWVIWQDSPTPAATALPAVSGGLPVGYTG